MFVLMVLSGFGVAIAQEPYAQYGQADAGLREQQHISVAEQNYADSIPRKTGWSFVPMPALSFNSDEGVQLGGSVNLYNYGNGERSPAHNELISFQFSYFTKGSRIFHLVYDTKSLIPDLRMVVTASYISDTVLNFWGFNGYASPYFPDIDQRFYTFRRNMLRATVCFHGQLEGNVQWVSGVNYYDYKTGKRAGLDEPTLYSLYTDYGIIRTDEKEGGKHIELCVGLLYDTRDNEYDPSRGIYVEGLMLYSPDVLNRNGSYYYLKGCLSFRQFVPLIDRKLVFGYHISYQGIFAGEIPFYQLPVYSMVHLRTVNPVLLGGANTLRGVNRSRVVSNGVIWTNLELRWKFTEFGLFGQRIAFALTPFFDAGRSLIPYRLREMEETGNGLIWSSDGEAMRYSAGLGLNLIMNRNFVISVDAGFPFDNRDGNFGLYFSMNYMF